MTSSLVNQTQSVERPLIIHLQCLTNSAELFLVVLDEKKNNRILTTDVCQDYLRNKPRLYCI